ncbi:DUF4397 domain-containing protein [Aminipila luticellarii]|nr:DUF4397 domain-containing protein [Aminipila luticellarii]
MNNLTVPENNSLGYVRVFHAVPDAPNMDVYADDTLIAENLPYGSYTDYVHLDEGTYTIMLYETGQHRFPLLSNMLTVHSSDVFTVAVCGLLSSISFLAITDFNRLAGAVNAWVRLVHLSPDAPQLDLTQANTTFLFRNISFKQASSYSPISPEPHDLQIRMSRTTTTLLSLPDVAFESHTFYTVYAIGLISGMPAFQTVISEDSPMIK